MPIVDVAPLITVSIRSIVNSGPNELVTTPYMEKITEGKLKIQQLMRTLSNTYRIVLTLLKRF